MSAWEGSDWQQAREVEANAARARRDAQYARLKRDNPSLCDDDIEELVRREDKANRPAPRCCACTTGKREMVRAGGVLGRCACTKCHGPLPAGDR